MPVPKPQSINQRLLKSMIPLFKIRGQCQTNEDGVTQYLPNKGDEFVYLYHQGAIFQFKMIEFLVDANDGEIEILFYETSSDKDCDFKIKFLEYRQYLNYED